MRDEFEAWWNDRASSTGKTWAWEAWQAARATPLPYAEGYADAIEIAAFYIADHCENGEHYADVIRRMTRPDAALATQQQAALPEGWKIVPVDPTPEMIQAGANSGGLGLVYHEWMGRIVVAWPKMLAAAPQPSPEPESESPLEWARKIVEARKRKGKGMADDLKRIERTALVERVVKPGYIITHTHCMGIIEEHEFVAKLDQGKE